MAICHPLNVLQTIADADFRSDKLLIFLLKTSIWAANGVTSLTSNTLAALVTNFPRGFH